MNTKTKQELFDALGQTLNESKEMVVFIAPIDKIIKKEQSGTLYVKAQSASKILAALMSAIEDVLDPLPKTDQIIHKKAILKTMLKKNNFIIVKKYELYSLIAIAAISSIMLLFCA